MKSKYSDEIVISAYKQKGSCKGAAQVLGLCPQTVHERLVKLGAIKSTNYFTDSEREHLSREYQKYAMLGKLEDLASSMGRTKNFICRKARDLGLTDKKRPRDYMSVWKNMTENEAQVLWDEFKRSSFGLGRFCKNKGIGEIGFWKTMTRYFGDEYEHVMESKIPKTTFYRLGRQFEYRVRDYLKKLGFFVLRSPASRSPTDLVAIRTGQVLLVQCKISGALPPSEWNELFSLAESVGAVPVLAEREGVRGLLFHRLLGKKDRSRKAQPYQKIVIE